ncbi:MAG: phosphoribosylformylglycinamidine synthase subunit PurS [Bdellovibrionales bacterium]
MKVRVDVMLKEGVLDPQGKAVGHALANQGYKGVDNVRVGKVIEFDLDAPSADRAKDMAKGMAEKLLANQVIEDFRIQVL